MAWEIVESWDGWLAIDFESQQVIEGFNYAGFETRNEAVVALDRWKIKQLPVPGEQMERRNLNLPPEVFDDFQEPEPPKPKPRPNQPEYRGHFR